MTIPDLAILSEMSRDRHLNYRTDFLDETMQRSGFRAPLDTLQRLQKDGLILRRTRTSLKLSAQYWHISQEGQKAVVDALIELGLYAKTEED